jgi:hypothetical protein
MKLKLRVILAVSAIGLFGGCSKIADVLRHPSEYQHLCRIEKFYLSYYDPITGVPTAPAEYDITYNAKGNPVEIKPADFSNTFGYISWFTYDKKDRLIDYRLDVFHSLTDTGIINAHHYYYAPNGRMIVDSEYQLPPANPVGQESPGRIDRLSLDAEGRVIKDSTVYYSGNTLIVQEIFDYIYNAKGNLTYVVDEVYNFFNATYSTYDDKVNWQQTSNTWQFINRDYSRNNVLNPAFQITGYNAFSLPKQFVYTPDPANYGRPGGVLFVESPYGYNILNFQYSCDVPDRPHK